MTSLREATRDLRFGAGLVLRRPFDVLLQVTNRCNLRCSFCAFWSNPAAPKDELTADDYRRLAGELDALGTFMVSIEGGEPLLREDLADIVRAFSGRHLPLVYTNGWHVDAARARELFDAGVVQVGVSIDFATAARHDAKRGHEGVFDRAWRAVELLRDAAPHGGRQVHVLTVLMRENVDDLEPLLARTAALGVGHLFTLVSTTGYRRAGRSGESWPLPPLTERLLALWDRYEHLRVPRHYVEQLDRFLLKGTMPACRAGRQSFNVDHLGNVSPCIERIDLAAGNVRTEPLAAIHARLGGLEALQGCQACWTLCRGMVSAIGEGGTPDSWRDLLVRMRSS